MMDFIVYLIFLLASIYIGCIIGYFFSWKLGRFFKEDRWPRD